MNKGTVAVGYLDPGRWSAVFGQSLVRMYLCDASTSKRIVPNGKELRNYCGSGGIVAGRNKVAAAFLDDTDCEWLFVVDSDMGFAPTIVEELIDAADPHKRPIVGALCFGVKRERTDPSTLADKFRVFPTVYDWVETDDEAGFRILPDYPRGKSVKVAGTGSAAILIHRRALRIMREKYGPTWYDPITHPKGKTGPTTFSEDLSFCIRAAACDLPIHVHTGVKTCHDKGGIFLDEEAFDRQQALDAPQSSEGAPDEAAAR